VRTAVVSSKFVQKIVMNSVLFLLPAALAACGLRRSVFFFFFPPTFGFFPLVGVKACVRLQRTRCVRHRPLLLRHSLTYVVFVTSQQ
jgi:hypothetical protein